MQGQPGLRRALLARPPLLKFNRQTGMFNSA